MCCENNGCIDYARLVHGIVGLLAHNQGIQSSKKAEEPLIITIGNTEDWDDIHYLDGHIIQRNCITGYFRVIEECGLYRTRFYSKSVIPLLDAIADLPQ